MKKVDITISLIIVLIVSIIFIPMVQAPVGDLGGGINGTEKTNLTTQEKISNITYIEFLRTIDTVRISNEKIGTELAYKTYNASKKEVFIEDNDNKTLIKLQLLSDYDIHVHQGDEVLVAEFMLLDYNKDNLFDNISLFDINSNYGEDKINRKFVYKYGIDYTEERCFEEDKEKICKNVTLTNWTTFKSLFELKEKNIKIGLFTNTQYNEEIEWIPNINGFEILEWASWISDSSIISGLPSTMGLGYGASICTFYYKNGWYLLYGDYQGGFPGFNWNGAGWTANGTINASLPDIGSYSAPTIFNMKNGLYLISGNNQGGFPGFNWNGANWVRNSTINASLPDIGGYSIPYIFNMKNGLYLISGNDDGGFPGFNWNGANWVRNSTINASLPDIGSYSAPTIFNMSNGLYLISGSADGGFPGFNWNGAGWTANGTINASLPSVSSSSEPTTLNIDNSFYLISIDIDGAPSGFLLYSDSTPPTVLLMAPANNAYNTTTNYIDFYYNVSETNTVNNCSLMINNVINQTIESPSKDTKLNLTVLLNKGTYKWGFNCTDDSNNIGGSGERSISLDNIPTHNNPILNSTLGTNTTSENITCWNQTTADLDGDKVYNKINWIKNNKSLTLLNMPLDINITTGIVKDYSSFSYNGTNKGAVYNTTDCKIGNCYTLKNSVNSYIDSNKNTTIKQNKATVMAWFKSEKVAGGAEQKILSTFGDTGDLFDLKLSSNDNITCGFWYDWNENSVTSTLKYANKNWHFVVCEWDTILNNISLWVDGKYEGSSAMTWEVTTLNLLDLEISSHQDGEFSGNVDEVRIINGTLSDIEHRAIYAYENTSIQQFNTIVSNELSLNDIWSCIIEPNDLLFDGTLKYSNNITILAPNTAPQFLPITNFSVNEDVADFVLDLSGNVSDAQDADAALKISWVRTAGTAINISSINNATNDVTFHTEPNASGTATFVLTLVDTGGLTNVTSFNITVNAVNDAPWLTATVGNIAKNEDAGSLNDLIAVADLNKNFSDVEENNAPTKYALISNNNTGLVTCLLDGSNNLDCTTVANQSGSARLEIQMNDSSNLNMSFNFNLNIASVNDNPWMTSAEGFRNMTVGKNNGTFTAITAAQMNANFSDVEENNAPTLIRVTQSDNSMVNCTVITGRLDCTTVTNQLGTNIVTLNLSDSGGLSFLASINVSVMETTNLGFLVTLPSRVYNTSSDYPGNVTSDIEFNATGPTVSYVNPCVVNGGCQNTTLSIFTYENFGNVNLIMKMNINATMPTGIVLFASPNNSYTNPYILSNSNWTFNSSLGPNTNQSTWLWVNCTNVKTSDATSRSLFSIGEDS